MYKFGLWLLFTGCTAFAAEQWVRIKNETEYKRYITINSDGLVSFFTTEEAMKASKPLKLLVHFGVLNTGSSIPMEICLAGMPELQSRCGELMIIKKREPLHYCYSKAHEEGHLCSFSCKYELLTSYVVRKCSHE